MNLVLDLLDAANPPDIQSQAVLVLVTALLDCPRNTRTFEHADGLLCLTSLFKGRTTTKEVKMRTLEFLYFYLMPEAPGFVPSASKTAVIHGGSEVNHAISQKAHPHPEGGSGWMSIEEDEDTRTMEAKQTLLGRHLDNVAGLVADLREASPFGAVVA